MLSALAISPRSSVNSSPDRSLSRLFVSVAISAPSPESFDEQTMAEATIADRQRITSELGHHRSDDASPSQDHGGAVGLEARDVLALLGVTAAVELDLPVDLGGVEHRSLH